MRGALFYASASPGRRFRLVTTIHILSVRSFIIGKTFVVRLSCKYYWIPLPIESVHAKLFLWFSPNLLHGRNLFMPSKKVILIGLELNVLRNWTFAFIGCFFSDFGFL